MATAEEDPELKELVIQSLENNGVLSKIRAQLRAGVFLALDETSTLQKSKLAISKKLQDYLSTRNGKLAACLVHEFLQYLELDTTLSVYHPDSYFGQLYGYEDRHSLAEALGLKVEDVPIGVPLLDHLVSHNVSAVDGFANGRHSHTSAFSAPFGATTRNSAPLVNAAAEVKEISSPDSLTPNDSANQHSGANECKDIHDPFFDDPIASDPEEFSNSENFFAAPNVGKYQKGSYLDEERTSSIDKRTRDVEKSKVNASESLGSLRNAPSIITDNVSMGKLPPLDLWKTSVSTDRSQETVPAQQKQITSSNLKHDTFRDDDYEEDFQSSASIRTDAKSGTEQSIEEDIDDNLSGVVDDLLSNDANSEADDATLDHTISHISNKEADYLESIG